MSSHKNRFPQSQYDLLHQNDLANNWVSPLLNIEGDTEAVEVQEGEINRIVVDTDTAQHEPHISQQTISFEAINYPDTCGHLDKDDVAILDDTLDIEHPGRVFAQFSSTAIEAGDIAAVSLLYHMLELL